jgi:ornithine cyclodeaminase
MRDSPTIHAEAIARLLDYPSLVDRLRDAFLSPPVAPDRMVLPIPATEGRAKGTLLVMPALRAGGLIVVKLVTVHPDLAHRPQGALSATLLALSASDGSVRGLVDGHALTARRTAAASVLAARLLARPDAHRLLVVGAGAVARALAEAYAAASGVRSVSIWARRAQAAEHLAGTLRQGGIDAQASGTLRDAAAEADIISTATLSQAPILTFDMIRPGTHLDLVGGFRPDMREADSRLVAAARVVADSPRALAEAGDLTHPIAEGLLDPAKVIMLDQLIGAPRARDPHEITLFKSVGLALEDLAAAELLFERLEE